MLCCMTLADLQRMRFGNLACVGSHVHAVLHGACRSPCLFEDLKCSTCVHHHRQKPSKTGQEPSMHARKPQSS